MLKTGDFQILDVQTRVISQRMQTASLTVVKAGFTAKETRFASMEILAVISILIPHASTMCLDNISQRMKRTVWRSTGRKGWFQHQSILTSTAQAWSITRIPRQLIPLFIRLLITNMFLMSLSFLRGPLFTLGQPHVMTLQNAGMALMKNIAALIHISPWV